VPPHIVRPPYAESGVVPSNPHLLETVYIHTDPDAIDRMRTAARWARRALDVACRAAVPGVTTDDIDTLVHNYLVEEGGAYPSPLNYSGFPKSICASINEVVCHGIPDTRPLQYGDVVSFDVSCFLDGVHGDNCATIIVGDQPDRFDVTTATPAPHDAAHFPESDPDANRKDWRGVPYKTDWGSASEEEEDHFRSARRLVRATRESLYAAIDACRRPDACLSHIGHAIGRVATHYGYQSVEKYRGHGICHEFHCAPFVKHYPNHDRLPLVPGMIFTIEPMLVMGRHHCVEWESDGWTVVTVDNSLAAQFEHTILIQEPGVVEILTVPE